MIRRMGEVAGGARPGRSDRGAGGGRTARGAMLVLAAVGALACGDGGSAPSATGVGGTFRGDVWFHRPALKLEGAPVDAERRLVERLLPPAESADLAASPWSAETDGEVKLGPMPSDDGAGMASLQVFGDGDKRVIVRGSFDPTAFNSVDVLLFVRARAPVTVAFRRDGAEVARSEVVWAPGGDVPHPLTAHLGDNRLQADPYDELVLEVGREGGPIFLGSLDLHWQDYAAWLPLPGEADLVHIGEEYREAVGLASTRPLRATLPDLDGDPARLVFSYGVAQRLAAVADRPAVRLQILDGATVVHESLHTFHVGRWSFAEMPLVGLEGEHDARFELVVEGSRGAVAALGEVAVVREGVDTPPPTVLLVTSDTHRADHLGAADLGVDVSTPALDALAARGVLFERGWSTSNITIPSHAALLTGRHPRDTRIVNNRTSLARSAPTLAERFRDGGYATYAVVSTRHLSHDLSGLGQGFERMFSPAAVERNAGAAVDTLASWLHEARDRPAFVWLHLFDAHGPYAPPEELVAPYVDMIEPGPGGMPHPDEVERMRYRGEVSFVDRELGRVLAHPRMADAVVAFTADHGESLGAHDIRFAHLELYPDTVHVPLVLAWPGAPAGTRVVSTARQMHVGRTLLDLAGLSAVDFPGKSLLDLAEAPATPRRDPVFSISAWGSSASMIHEGHHLVIHLFEHHVGPGKAGRLFERHETELFDLENDPLCGTNLAQTDPELTQRMRRILVGWLNQAEETGWATQANLDPDQLRDLENLGYLASKPALDAGWIDPACECNHCAIRE